MKPVAGRRGYFAIGAERISKPMNLGAILRTAHAFGASFAFTIKAHHNVLDMEMADTSRSSGHLPLYHYGSATELRLPEQCTLVGIELTEEAIDLPSFRHPRNAAYLLGPEDGSISPELQEQCEFVVRIPTRFCINLGLAAALVMYDRSLSLDGWPPRPIVPGGPELGPAKSWPSYFQSDPSR
ncbi:MAG: rRNA methyltransferase [Robiginitomaculum sp.]|nr:MAG: rRNA methyltransferase [Robiginitomaculum sp.]